LERRATHSEGQGPEIDERQSAPSLLSPGEKAGNFNAALILEAEGHIFNPSAFYLMCSNSISIRGNANCI